MSMESLQVIFCIFLFISAKAAANSKTKQPAATWETSSRKIFIAVDTSPMLSDEQREIIKSGFSTFTLLTITDKKNKDHETPTEMRTVCKVKYDTWEEKYITTKLEPQPLGKYTGNTIESWSDQCLKYRIEDPRFIAKMKNGGLLFISLQVRQSSLDEATKIKDWLVKQQSGLMQGLYSHMLGDLQLGGKTDFIVEIPPQPEKMQSHGVRDTAKPK